MENTSYALYIAVGVLIAITILSVLLFNWRKIGRLESSKDDVVAVKNKADFNAEYEAYNRGLMYGSDVLSCLNKAQNNNQKYVYNNYYGTETETIGKDDRVEYFMDVDVKIYSTLCDSVRAYYKDEKGKYQRVIGLTSANQSNYIDKVFGSGTNAFKSPTIYYYYFKKGLVYQNTSTYADAMWENAVPNKTLYDILNTGKIETKFIGTPEGTTYHLLTSEDTTTTSHLQETSKLAALISTVSLKEQKLVNNPEPTDFVGRDWWYCTWTTAASDFKSRKFKCTGTHYNETTGYIDGISFEELK